ncbi:MAG: response regulator transcription factor [Myxococcales bacterium]|nr:response regulator transcription factor [Myxococcales bacterium]
MNARAVIIEDEPSARDRLARMLADHLAGRVELVGTASDGEAGLALIAEHAPDLAFVDVQMPGLDGIEMAARLGSPAPYVIFTTAHDRYALDAFDAGAIDYLLKPFDAERLVRAVGRAESLGLKARGDEVLAPLREAQRAMPRVLSDKLPITVNGRVLLVPVSDISHCIVEHELVTVHTSRGDYTTDYTLTALEGRLDPAKFFRAHRALLVNLDHVAAIDDMAGGRAVLVTHAGVKLVVSRQSSRRLRQMLGV